MRLNDKAWIVSNGYVEAGTVADFTRGDCTVDEFFTSEADAYDALAAMLDAEAAHKLLGADSARARAEEARKKAEGLRRTDAE